MIRWKVWWSLLIPPFRMKTDGQIYFRPEALKKIKSLLCEIFEVCELVSQQHVWRHVSVKKWYRNDQLLSRYFDILRYLRWKLLQILETGPALISLDLWICFLCQSWMSQCADGWCTSQAEEKFARNICVWLISLRFILYLIWNHLACISICI